MVEAMYQYNTVHDDTVFTTKELRDEELWMVSRMGEVNCKICSLNSFEKKSYKEIVELMPMSYYEIELRLYCSHNGKRVTKKIVMR